MSRHPNQILVSISVLIALYSSFCNAIQSGGSPLAEGSSLVCNSSLMGATRHSWISAGDVIVQNISIEDLLPTGTAHIPIPNVILKQLVADPELFDYESGEKLRSDIISFLLTTLNESLPEWEIASIGGVSSSGAGMGIAPSGWRWHRDASQEKVVTRDEFAMGLPSELIIRVNFPLPLDLVPPTVVIPSGGALRGKHVQGTFDHFTVFILEVTMHSAPLRAAQRAGNYERGIYAFDFQAKRR